MKLVDLVLKVSKEYERIYRVTMLLGYEASKTFHFLIMDAANVCVKHSKELKLGEINTTHCPVTMKKISGALIMIISQTLILNT